ncbi:flavodoxin-dependent (E)-4-hydroxy-3-methylbut-2-enyl-diphosphate synthase [Desulfurobacterium atlanticum]|uniref:4-hydroxy-3-methylbut-2-en-1-yl diphosphate synthase (flavodoxin) n=1 Tax=Desulfurobacterium atlanticum TaxID=240169 RepID=A0A239A5F6_9BACT|nr:flavodoxin-dependent (E)-4-hydroxy-3-methylbut-2-enyl-diphosphate synthase [Desulfurobacterium atlanticum]SNR90531.1 4-hydroxy-3-methylbut-2-en-1-yl diphosphate synthase [Desulfurobacterium atlanticum]
MWIKKRTSKVIYVGNVPIGGENPIVVQSMTNTFTEDVKATVNQIKELEKVGCEIVRVAVPTKEAAENIKKIKEKISIPLIADIHFDHKLAILSIEKGTDGIRINPGNIGSQDKVREIIKVATERNIPIRIGVNTGSLPKNILAKYGHPSPEAVVETALNYMKFFEDEGFTNMKFSLKGSDIRTTVIANELFAKKCKYPIHIGITEAGTVLSGAVKSATGIGILLYKGIGDTLRVSLSSHPKVEVKVAFKILSSLGLRKVGVDVISCPTCGRCVVNLPELALKIEEALEHIKAPVSVAVMGCAVNGPGEASFADVGIAAAGNTFILFSQGKIIGKYPEKEVVEKLIKEVERVAVEKSNCIY